MFIAASIALWIISDYCSVVYIGLYLVTHICYNVKKKNGITIGNYSILSFNNNNNIGSYKTLSEKLILYFIYKLCYNYIDNRSLIKY